MKITIGDRGIVEERSDLPTTVTIPGMINAGNRVMIVNSSGTLSSSTISKATRYEFVSHLGSQTLDTTVRQIQINGLADNIHQGDLSVWNTQSNKLIPDQLNDVYTVRFEGLVDPPGGNRIMQLGFIVSGSDLTSVTSNFRQNQVIERTLRNATLDNRIHGMFTFFVDANMLASGAIFVAVLDGSSATLVSASVFIKEG